mmetsp:Transcript_11544/g.25746  ORF Transcript_11544/g.25746 Transcript_11544/m.25746 type:complete len:263 (+) Transcript_11544:40-828(+)
MAPTNNQPKNTSNLISQQAMATLLQLIVLAAFTIALVQTFSPRHHTTRRPSVVSSSSQLFATKKKKKTSKNTKKSTASSFGGASLAECPCGSGQSYTKCCGILHRNAQAYQSATAEQVVRARYSAFARKQPDFLMASTHPFNKDFNPDLKKWKESIKLNMYDKFELPRCVIVEETPLDDEDKQTKIQFIAQMVLKDTGEVTAFMETALLERAPPPLGTWLYVNGTIDAVPNEFALENNITFHDHSEDAAEENEGEEDQEGDE